MYRHKSAAYMALEWCANEHQPDAFLPFIRCKTFIPHDAVDLYESLLETNTNKDTGGRRVDDASGVHFAVQYLEQSSRKPLYLRKIADELLLNRMYLALMSQQLSRMITLSRRFIIGETRSISETTGYALTSEMADTEYAENLAMAMRSDKYLAISDLLADPRFGCEQRTGPLFGWNMWTSMHLAASNASENVLQILIRHGLDIDSRDVKGFTPLNLCKDNRHIPVIKVLLEAGANSTIGDSAENDTIWHLAARNDSLEIL